MIYQIFKRIGHTVLFILLLTGLGHAAYAFDCSTVPAFDCSQVNLETPLPSDVLCPIVRVFNLVLLSLGVVFLILIVYGSIKLAMALGDPKGYQGAQQTFTFAILGAFVVAGFFGIFLILSNILDISPFSGPNAIISQIHCALWRFIDAAGITNTIPVTP